MIVTIPVSTILGSKCLPPNERIHIGGFVVQGKDLGNTIAMLIDRILATHSIGTAPLSLFIVADVKSATNVVDDRRGNRMSRRGVRRNVSKRISIFGNFGISSRSHSCGRNALEFAPTFKREVQAVILSLHGGSE